MKVTAWIQTEGHQREGVEAGVQVRDCPDGIQAVFADAVSAGPLCPDFGMGIEIDVEGEVEEYMGGLPAQRILVPATLRHRFYADSR